MNCQQIQTLLHPYVDGELDLVKNLEIEQHLGACPICAQAHTDIQAVRATVKASAPYFPPPPELAGRIRDSLRAASLTGPVRAASQSNPPRPVLWPWLAMAASLAFVAITSWSLARYYYSPPRESLPQELLASHVRSQMLPNHLVDKESSDQHTVRPWFDGKLDFSPPVPDLSDRGFDLIGGRLDYLDSRPVAVLVYQRRNHLINLFIWRLDPEADAGPTMQTRQGYQLLHWVRSGTAYWAVSNLNEAELGEFGRLIRDRAP